MIPLGFVVLGVLVIRNPMLFWRLEMQKPSWCRRHDRPDKGWLTEMRLFGVGSVIIGTVGFLLGARRFIYWLF